MSRFSWKPAIAARAASTQVAGLRHNGAVATDPKSRPIPPGDPSTWSDLDRHELPHANEDESDTAWATFQALSEPVEFAPTQPASMPMPLPKGDPRYATTVPGALMRDTTPAPLGPLAPPVHRITLDAVVAEARRNNRVCPQPQPWQQLYEMLPDKKQNGRTWEPPPPLTGSAWGVTPSMTKRMCLRDQLEWAEKKGRLAEVYAFLKALPEESWHHVGD